MIGTTLSPLEITAKLGNGGARSSGLLSSLW